VAEPAAAALAVEGARKAFGGLVAVGGVSLELRAGEVHALIGPNGAGKSTLAGLIAGDLAPDAGTVRLEGRDVTREPAWARARRGLGRGFQVPRLFAGADDVTSHALVGALAARGLGFGLWRDAARDPDLVARARAALEGVGLAGLGDRPVGSLAHGQRRRLELATVLAARPRVLLLDEPLAGLGPEEGAAITRLVAGLRDGRAILLIEHDMDAVWALADRVSVLVEGRLAASGMPAEVRRDPVVRAAYLGEERAVA
jgi:branched-chain amino acid transport system ATP-binding protein